MGFATLPAGLHIQKNRGVGGAQPPAPICKPKTSAQQKSPRFEMSSMAPWLRLHALMGNHVMCQCCDMALVKQLSHPAEGTELKQR